MDIRSFLESRVARNPEKPFLFYEKEVLSFHDRLGVRIGLEDPVRRVQDR